MSSGMPLKYTRGTVCAYIFNAKKKLYPYMAEKQAFCDITTVHHLH
ncbi:hypothetical protein T06_13259 [Trichinella sp. T6]|nr:hypothetical protein T06_13259 [Trichinella sp. T6]